MASRNLRISTEFLELRPIISPTTRVSSLDADNSDTLEWNASPKAPSQASQPPVQKPASQYGMEVAEYALVWNVYNEESSKIDAAELEASNRGIDVLLVFTGLFSAVLTTFIIQSYQLMLPNPMSVANTQYCAASNGAKSTNCSLPEGLDPGPTLTEIRWVNGLWFAALSCSLSAALFSMLAKHWLQPPPNISGSPQHRARQRQRRYLQMQAWHVMTVVNALPLLLHVTLLLFFAGLIVLLWSGNRAITVVTCAIVALVFVCYFGSIWLSMSDPDCPYQHPISEHLRAWVNKGISSMNSPDEMESAWLRPPYPWNEEVDSIPAYVSPHDLVDASMLVWLIEKCPNPFATAVSLQAIAGLPRNFTAFRLLREAGAVSLVLKEFRPCFHQDSTLGSQWYVLEPEIAERYCRAWMRLTAGTSIKWPGEFLKPLEALQQVQVGSISAIAACTRAITFLEDKDGRLALLSYLAQCEEEQDDFSHEMQCWLLDTFLQCSFISQPRFRPSGHIVQEAVPILLRLLHKTKQTLASRVRSAVALSLSYMTGTIVDLALFNDEETRREQFTELLIPSLTAIVDAPENFAVDDELLDLIALEFPRIASLALLPSSTDRKHLKPIAQRGLLNLYLQGRMKDLSGEMLANVLQILYPPTMLARTQHPLFVKLLLDALRFSFGPRGMVESVLRLLEPVLSDPHPDLMDTFIEGRGVAVLLRAISAGDTESRLLQLDCIRNICLFIQTATEYCNNPSVPSSAKEYVMEHIQEYIFQSDLFFTMNAIVKARLLWLPEIAEIWVPSLLKLCDLRPQEPVWKSIESTFRKYAEMNEARDGCFHLLDDLVEMKALISPGPRDDALFRNNLGFF